AAFFLQQLLRLTSHPEDGDSIDPHADGGLGQPPQAHLVDCPVRAERCRKNVVHPTESRHRITSFPAHRPGRSATAHGRLCTAPHTVPARGILVPTRHPEQGLYTQAGGYP